MCPASNGIVGFSPSHCGGLFVSEKRVSSSALGVADVDLVVSCEADASDFDEFFILYFLHLFHTKVVDPLVSIPHPVCRCDVYYTLIIRVCQ